MRCESCAKFVSLETVLEDENPAIEVGTFSSEGDAIDSLNGSVRVVRTCADCGTEMKSLDFEIEVSDVKIEGAPLAEEDWADVEAEANINVSESGGGRYKKNLIGYAGVITVMLGERILVEVPIKDSAPASAYEEC